MTTQHSLSTGSGSPFPASANEAAIDRVQARLVAVPLGAARGGSGATQLQLVHLTVTDSDGAEGSGFTYTLGSGAEAVLALLEAVHVPAIANLPLWQWDRTWYQLLANTHRLGTGVTQLATSAVDIAVWDLRARRAGLPLHRLLGSKRDTIPIYGSGRAAHAMSVDELVVGAHAYVDEGYSAIKLRAGFHSPANDVARTAAVRDAVGPNVTIMIDCNERLDLTTAQWLAPRLAELDVYWLEEPLPASDIAGHRTLANRSPVPLAVGEHLLGLPAFVPYTSSAGVWQPDAPLTGGVSEFLRIAALAEAHGVAISPHFLPEFHVQLAAAATTSTWIEHFPLIDELLLDVLHPHNGVVDVPACPGHGMAWNDDAIDPLHNRKPGHREVPLRIALHGPF